MGSWRSRVVVVGVVMAVLCGVFSPPAQARPPAPASYYLSLGDSLAFGYQPNLVAAGDINPADYRSYAEDLASADRHLTLVNYGCPGETTGTLINGGCPWPAPLHDSYGGASSQLAAAQVFLATHAGRVSLVTIDVGNNDLLALVARCQASAVSASSVPSCLVDGLPTVLATIAANYQAILQTVTALAPHAEVVVLNLYNPFASTLTGSDQLIAVVNQTLAEVAAAAHARLADAFGAINVKAGSPVEKLSLCVLTWECSSYQNVHPTTLGYASLTFAVAAALR